VLKANITVNYAAISTAIRVRSDDKEHRVAQKNCTLADHPLERLYYCTLLRIILRVNVRCFRTNRVGASVSVFPPLGWQGEPQPMSGSAAPRRARSHRPGD
jgi:hypothetical protein